MASVATEPDPMLIIPLEKAFDWKRPPVVTLLLIVVNVFVYLVIQTHDDQRLDVALEFYLESVLPEIELPLYAQTGAPDVVANWELLHEAGMDDEAQVYLLSEMQSDEHFMQQLHAGELVDTQHPEYAAWRSDRDQFDKLLGATTSAAYGFTPASPQPATFFTYMFLHGSLGHLLGNMLFFLVVGLAVELTLGWRIYLGFYLGCGLASVLLYWAVYSSSDMPLVGASGAIAGLMGLYAILFGTRRIRFFYWSWCISTMSEHRRLFWFPIWLAVEFAQLTWGDVSSVAYVAHIGGLLAGGLLAVGIKAFPDRVDTDYLDASQRAQTSVTELDNARRLLGSLEIDRARATLKVLGQEYPHDREIQLQVYRLEKFDPQAKAFHQAALQLLNSPNDDLETLRSNHETFLDYVEATEGRIRLPSALLVQLSIRFAKAGFLRTSTWIVKKLLALQTNAPGLEQALVFIAKRYQQRNDHSTHRRYLKLLVEHFPAGDAAKTARAFLDGQVA